MTVREALLASDDAVYRTAQVVTALHAHRARGPWLRLVAVGERGDGVDLLAVQGDRVRRPGATIGLQSQMAHVQHLQTRCQGDLGADPATLSMLVERSRVLELLSTAQDEQIAELTRSLAAALDDRSGTAKAARPRLWFRSAPAAPDLSRVAGQITQLRALLNEIPMVPLEDVALAWDDVQEQADTTP